jgi:hypothetical protein
MPSVLFLEVVGDNAGHFSIAFFFSADDKAKELRQPPGTQRGVFAANALY